MKRALLVAAAAVLLVVAWTTAYDGEVRLVQPNFSLRILDSAGWSSITNTGLIDIVVDRSGTTRRLLTQPAYNSSGIPLLLSRVYASGRPLDRRRVGDLRGWNLFVFTPGSPAP